MPSACGAPETIATACLADTSDLNTVDAEVFLILLTQVAFDLANLGLMNSGIPTWFNLLSTQEVEYIEVVFPGLDVPAEQIVADLAGFGDGEMDIVHTLRNQQAADIVILVTGRLRPQPLWPDMNTFEIEQASGAFGAVDIECLPQLTLAHEIGHLMGAFHDRYVIENGLDDGGGFDTTLYEDFGFRFTLFDPKGPRAVRTVMAYPHECRRTVPNHDCTLIPRWSNPADTSQFGEPLGIEWGFADAADNAKVPRDNRAAVSIERPVRTSLPGRPRAGR